MTALASMSAEGRSGAMSEEVYEAAERRVDQMVGLVIHLLAFVTVNAVLFSGSGFDLAAGHFWGWGVGLGAHVLVVLGNATTFKQRMIERELRHAGGREASAVPSPSRVAPVLMIHKIPCVTYD